MGTSRTSLAQHRRMLGYSQQQLAEVIGVELSTVGRWERGNVAPQPWARRALAGNLRLSLAELDHILTDTGEYNHRTTSRVSDSAPSSFVTDLVRTISPRQHQCGAAETIALPGGRALPGTSVAVSSVPIDTARGEHTLPAEAVSQELYALLYRGDRSLVLTMGDDATTTQVRGIDGTTAKRQLTRYGSVCVPEAFVLDELTLGLTWALLNYDDATLADDDLLETSREELTTSHDSDRSLPAELLAQMSLPSQMMLGSHTCADFILNNLAELDTAPTFWTREQHGEDASSWLFFRHKLEYLIATGDPQAPPEKWPIRLFCVPQADVDDSTTSERILLLLAAALMESTGIRSYVTSAPELSSVDGFVLGARHALIANWVRTGSVWHTNHVRARYRLHTLDEISHYGMASAINRASDSTTRLSSFADYLGLDWLWLVQRCRMLGEQSFASLARPRSRRLSTAGADRACRYIAGLSVSDPYSPD